MTQKQWKRPSRNMKILITHMVNVGILRSQNVIKAFLDVDRANFILPWHKEEAYEDHPLSIGHNQTISQPTTVAFMLELLGVEPGNAILDVGSGSGWTTALLGRLVGKTGRVFGVERIPELVAFGNKNIEKYNTWNNISIAQSGKKLGLEERAPFDRILVSAAATKLPHLLVDQLKQGGVLVIPIGNAIHKITKLFNEEVRDETYEGFTFVPLIVNES